MSAGLFTVKNTITCLAARHIKSFQFQKILNMDREQIVPDVIDVVPPKVAKVLYAGGVEVKQGNVLRPRQVKDCPKVVSWDVEKGYFYTICMTDPDAPSRAKPDFREWHHWLVGNIPENDIDKGETLSAYIGSGPPKGTGLHRYCFLVFRQNSKIAFTEKKLPNNSGDGRGKFSIRKFASKYHLGDPIAGNFYLAEWDDYVPELYKQLEG